MKFKFLYRRAIREAYASGQMSAEQYSQLTQVLRHPIRKRLRGEERVDILAEIEKYTLDKLPKEGINWNGILQWLKDNWQEILKLVLSLVVLLEPAPKDK